MAYQDTDGEWWEWVVVPLERDTEGTEGHVRLVKLKRGETVKLEEL